MNFSKMLCNVCHSIFQRPLQFDDSIHRWWAWLRQPRPLSEVRLSAGQEKCYTCIAILKQWGKHSFDPDKDGDDLQLTYKLNVPKEVSESQLVVGLYLKEKKLCSFMLWLVEVQTDNNLQPLSKASDSTGSPETLQFLKDCVQECKERHPQCHDSRKGTNWYPMRLVDVGIAGDDLNKDTVKLIITAEITPHGPYASLSHCWGESQIKKLEQESLESMKNEILLRELPKTFQDTAVVCRALNIRYVWIDSLCIIQDCNDDWQREARTMLDVYTNASINIAATSAPNGQIGLFQERDTQTIGVGSLRIKEGVLKGQRGLLDPNYWSESIDGAVLNTRAWVVQERLLSSRIIHFGSDQVFWDCCSLTACELYPSGVHNWSSNYKGGWINNQESLALVRNPQSDEQVLKHWGRAVEAYSASHLTFQKDKLIALSGIVKYMLQFLRDRFCAGLWRRKIEMQLAWHTVQGASERRRSDPLRAPTWSWLSMIAPVKYTDIDGYCGYEIIERATVTEIKLEYNTPDEKIGEVVTGYLRMRCILNPVKLCGEDKRLQFLEPGLENLRSSLSLDTTAEADNETLYFIPLFDTQCDTWGKPPRKASQTRGILTKRVANCPGTYNRVGHAHVIAVPREPCDEDFSLDYVTIRTAKGKEMLPCEEYDADLGHLIKLV